jgi:hypothetical protein
MIEHKSRQKIIQPKSLNFIWVLDV